MRRRHLVTLALVSVFGLGSVGAGSTTPEGNYLTAPVERGDITTSLSASGTLNAVVTVKVGSQLSGQIAELFADFNDKVEKGQPIARLDPSLFAAKVRQAEAAVDIAATQVTIGEASVEQAEANLASARASQAVSAAQVESARAKMEQARHNLERKRQLLKRDALSQATLDDAAAEYQSAVALVHAAQAEQKVRESAILAAEASLKVAQAELRHAQAAVEQQTAALEQARTELERTVIRSPIDGEVISRDVDRGQIVAASLQAPTLFTIVQDLRQMEVHARINEADIGWVRLGQEATFTVDAYPDRAFRGTVAQIRKAPETLQNVVAYTVVLTVDNPDRSLLPGMTAMVQIVVERVADVLKVPNAALRFRPPGASPSEGGARVWVLDASGTPAPVGIMTGRNDAIATEVDGGALRPGQAVIVGMAPAGGDAPSLGFRWGI